MSRYQVKQIQHRKFKLGERVRHELHGDMVFEVVSVEEDLEDDVPYLIAPAKAANLPARAKDALWASEKRLTRA